MDPETKLAVELTHLTSRDEYLQATSELLLKLFPSDVVSWNALDARAREAEVFAVPDNPLLDVAGKLLEIFHDHPLVISYFGDTSEHRWEPRRLSDVVTDQQLYRTRAYQEGLEPYGANRQLSILADKFSPTGIHGWAMNRWNVDFTDEERDLARRLQPMLHLLDSAYAAQGHTIAAGALGSLTPREEEIMRLEAKGLTAVAVGHLLGISPRTVSKHLERIYAKLGCSNRVDALASLRGERT